MFYRKVMLTFKILPVITQFQYNYFLLSSCSPFSSKMTAFDSTVRICYVCYKKLLVITLFFDLH